MKLMKMHNNKTKKYLGEAVIADKLFARTQGLLGTESLPDYQGLIIKPCRQVHTIGMRFPISIWFMDKQNNIIKIIDKLKPYRISPLVSNSYYVIEFPENWAQKTGSHEGDSIKLFD